MRNDVVHLKCMPQMIWLMHVFSDESTTLYYYVLNDLFVLLQYSAWLDQHNTAEALKSIKAALEASPAEAKQADVLAIMLQLCQGT